MRSQDDYLRDFAVLMTEKGVVAMSDPQQIAVYDILCGGKKRPSDIAEALGLPSSSLHFVLDKMVDAGIIVRSKPDPAKKEVYYSILALRIAGSSKPSPEAVAESREVFSSPDARYTGLSSVANMLDSYLAEIGLEHGQLRARYAKDLAAANKDAVGTGPIDSVMQSIKERFCAITGFRLSVFSLNPPTMVFEGDASMKGKMDMLSLFVKYMMENATGKTLSVASSEDFSNEESVRIKVVYERSEPEPEPYVNTSLPQMAEPEKFMVVEIDGGVALLMNDIQTQLVEAIYERPLCVTDVVNIVNMPRSTVTTNLLRMVEEGVASVFYSESGALYYGLSCSILMKRTRRVSKDPTPTRNAVKAASRDGGFVEGYMLYLLSSLHELGFDTDYMMVVLGARYMRAVGQDGPKNFDSYFGKMSDISRVFGLSLSVVSVYPLTIGIAKEGDEPLVPAMTFVKGMAHQGLEMASSGIFVRVSEETPEDMKVSFKEIYPSLSMTPAAGSEAEAAAADAAPAKKKRTSSVRDALRNRSAKSDGRPLRTVRYITGIAMVVFAAMIVVLAMSGDGNDNLASGETYKITAESGISLYDADGSLMSSPYIVKADQPVTFTIGCDGVAGVVVDGVAQPMTSLYADVNGAFTVSLSGDIDILVLKQIDVDADGLTVSFYDFGEKVNAKYANEFDGYVPADGTVWASGYAWLLYEAVDGSYVSFGDDEAVYMDRVCVQAWSGETPEAEKVPADCIDVTMSLVSGDVKADAAFEYEGRYISGDVKVAKNAAVALKFISTDGPVIITLIQDGRETQLNLSQDRTVVFSAYQDVSIVCTYTTVF